MPWQGGGSSGRAGESMFLQWRWEPNRSIVIEVGGAVDAASSTRFAELIRERLSPSVCTLVLDLSRVSFCDTDGIVVLTEAAHRSQVCGTKLALVTGNRAIDAPLDLLGLGDRFTYAETVTMAIGEDVPGR